MSHTTLTFENDHRSQLQLRDNHTTQNQVNYSNRIKSPDLSLEENLKRTEEYVRKKFPEKFGTTTTKAANGHAAVDGGGMAPGAMKTDPLSKLPNEARAQAKADMAKFPKMYPSAEAWIKAYNS